MYNKPDDTLVAAIDVLLETFRGAMIALLPFVEQSQMGWRDDDHPDWEGVCAALFRAFVQSPIAADFGRGEGDFPLAPYDIDLDDYRSVSWLKVSDESSRELAFVRFLTVDAPFDSAQLVEIEPGSLVASRRLTVSWPGGGFALARHNRAGAIETVTEIKAVE